MAHVKRSVALILETLDRRFVLVRRPEEPDEELPGVWGLPAGTRGEGEDVERCAVRVARQKLGLDIEPEMVVESGALWRGETELRMDLVHAHTGGTPVIQPPPAGDTRTYYTDLELLTDPVPRLLPGARQGSLCCQLLLNWWSDREGPVRRLGGNDLALDPAH